MIHLEIPGVPPTTNKAYFDHVVRVGKAMVAKRTLTTEGKAYKRETMAALVERYPQELQFFLPNVAYGMWTVFAMPSLLNKGWPTKAKSRYKKLDASNRLKLFEDALSTAVGIDDSQLFTSAPTKIQSEDKRTLIWVWDLEDEGMLPYELCEHLRQLQPY